MISNLLSLARILDACHRIMYAVLRWIGLLFGIMPKAGRLPPYSYALIHYGFVIMVTVLLAWYSNQLIPESRVTWPYWFVQRFYVAIQFLLFYMFVRLLIIGIQLFLSRDLSEFEDINAAWEGGLEALAREGFDLQWLPVFLVNGATFGQQKSLFESARIPWKVNNSDESRPMALSFHASDEALFICLNDVGAVSRQLRKAPTRGGAGPAAAAAAAPVADAGIPATMRPDQLRSAIEQTRRPEAHTPGKRPISAPVAGATMPPPSSRMMETIRPGAVADALAQGAPASPGTLERLTKEELLLNQRRLDYFCQLLTVERGTYCPVNGLLQVIPLRWTQSAAHEPLMAAVGQDVQTLHDGLHLQFPVVVLHAGIEELDGLTPFIERGKELDSRFRDSRAGSRYPGGLAIDDKTSSWVIDRSLIWFRDWIYAEFAKSLSNPTNRLLYQFLCSLSLRRERLVRELRTTIGEIRLKQPVRLTGCYFAATGADASRQAFVSGVMQRLMSEQNEVAWRPEWRARDRRCLWFTAFLAVVTLSVLAADCFLVWKIWEFGSRISAG